MVGNAAGQLRPTRADIAADPGQRQIGDHQPAEHQQRDLHDISQRHRLQPALDLVGEREHAEQDECQRLVDARDLDHRDRAQPDDAGEVHEHVQRQPEYRHQRADARAVPPLQELRHGVDLVGEEDRQEKLADDQQRQRRHPLVRRDGETDRIARPRHADDLFGRDIGRDQRCADRPPGQVLGGEEIIGGVLGVASLFAADPLRQREDADGVEHHHRDIDVRQTHRFTSQTSWSSPRCA